MRVRLNQRSRGRFRRRVVQGLGMLGLIVLGYCCGRSDPTTAQAGPPFAKTKADTVPPPAPLPPAAVADPDYSLRPVAYIYGTIPITRRDLGEYLIARQGAEKLEYLVNKRIIEHSCKAKGIEVSMGEVEAALADDLKRMSVSLHDFEHRILKQYKKTLFEWKEDVIRPRLALTKLCQSLVKVTAQDLEHAFEAHYGEKVEGRIILFPKGEEELKIAMQLYKKIQDSEEEFSRLARQNASPALAATAGRIRPISRYSTGNEELEREAFGLRVGEVSKIVGTPEGNVIFKCDGRKPRDTSKELKDVRAELEKEIVEKKTQVEMHKFFNELKKEAQPKLFLQKYKTEEDWLRDIQQDLRDDLIPVGNNRPTGPPPRK